MSNANRAACGMRMLLTGEKVPEFVECRELRPITTHCPGKWVFVDLENGGLYAWEDDLGCYTKPPRKAAAALRKALKAMSPKKSRAKRSHQ